jgi:DNA-binding CsgD family transcriptional regulator
VTHAYARRGDPLTERELGILLSLADGASLVEIARNLLLSVETIRSHMASVREKLGAKNAAHAVALAYHRRLLLIPGA